MIDLDMSFYIFSFVKEPVLTTNMFYHTFHTFSGEADRMGSDIDLGTSSIYITGVKISRLCGDPMKRTQGNRPEEYFLETSHSYKTFQPVSISSGKENSNYMNSI